MKRFTKLVTLIALIVLLCIVSTVFAQGKYYVPIEITELSGNDLYNYTVKIELNETNFPGWEHVLSENGSDIYFLDVNKKPLYYWIEYFNKTEKKAIIWVKIPHIPANSTTIIYMYYGGDNPYSDYNDRYRVFLLFIDFENGSMPPYKTDAEGYFSVEQAPISRFGKYALHYSTGRSASRWYNIWFIEKNFTRNILIEADTYATYTDDDRGILILSQGSSTGNNYNPVSSYLVAVPFSDYQYVRIRKIDETGTVTDLAETSLSPREDYHIVIKVNKTTIVVEVYDFSNNLLTTLSVEDTSIQSGYIGVTAPGWDSNRNPWFDNIIVRHYVDPEPSIEIGKEFSTGVKLPVKSIVLTHNITYSPKAVDFTHSIAYTVNSTTTSIVKASPHDWAWKIIVQPYINNTGYLTPDKNATLLGTWVSGTVSDLVKQDNTYFWFKTYNDTNTMRLHITVNVTTLGWLVSDSTIKINEIEVVVAGNLSKVINTKASLEILDWSSNTWVSIDDVAWNQTSVTTKTYKLSSIYTGDLKNLISSNGVIAFRINITDVQSYPSTIIDCSFDQLNVKIIYTNETEAKTIHEIVIKLPYGKALVKNVTIDIKANGTGTTRQVSIEVLNATGYVITGVTNASFSTTWTTNVININQELSDNITVRVIVYEQSTLDNPEEIDISNVKVFTENVFNPVVTCPIVANEKYFNCSFIHTFDLGNSSLVNETFSKIYIINYLIYNTSDYPVKPSYVSNVTINNDVYNVYVIDPSNYTGSYIFYVLLENRYRSGVWKVHYHGLTLDKIIIGDVVCIDLPETGNITIRLNGWNHTWLNTSHICWRINNTGTLTIDFIRNLTNIYDIGYGSYVITVTYGNLTINTLDINNTLISYEELKMVMYNRDWGLKYEGKGFGKFFRNDLWAGNYTVTIYYLDVPICNFTYWLNSTNTGSVIYVTCNMFKQGKDYRGINKTIAWMWNVTLLNVTNLNKKYPWSITKFVLNGSSGAKFCIAWDYESDLPTAINVEGNASELTWKWVNTTLIICGKFGSTVYVTVTDLYKLSIKYFDRLGRLLKYLDKLPETIINNEIVLKGYDVWIYLPPEDYVVKVPKEIVKNFVFPLHNVNGSTVNTISFSIVHSDVLIKPVYKVPVEFTELKIVYVTPSEVYVQGRLVDYLGYPVVNKSIYVELWSLVKNYRLDGDLVKTDEAGYFITKPFTIPVNESVMFRIWFEGDDIYNGNETSIEIMQVSTYTVKPSIWQKPEIIIIALIILAVIIILIAVLKRGKVVALSSRKKMFKIT